MKSAELESKNERHEPGIITYNEKRKNYYIFIHCLFIIYLFICCLLIIYLFIGYLLFIYLLFTYYLFIYCLLIIYLFVVYLSTLSVVESS